MQLLVSVKLIIAGIFGLTQFCCTCLSLPHEEISTVSILKRNDIVFQPQLIGGYPVCLEDSKGGYCNLDRSYPRKEIEQLLVNSNYFQDLATVEKRFQNTQTDLSFDVDIDGAFNFSTTIDNAIPGEEESTCAYRVTAYHPPVAISEETSKWVYVVNVDKYTQIIKGQVCERSSSCGPENLPTSYKSNCIQRFKSVTLLAIEPNNKVPYKDKFKFPSFCECDIKSQVFLKEKTNWTEIESTTFISAYG